MLVSHKTFDKLTVSGLFYITKGEWIYKTEVQEKILEYTDTQCTSIAGTVDIVQSSDSNIVDIQGWRRACVNDTKSGTYSKQKISWSSDIAVIVPRRNKLFFWLKTTDNPSRYGFVSALVTQPSGASGTQSTNPQVIKGTMYYLNETTNSWSVTQIYLYRSGTSEASEIRGIARQ
ncbi:hypothetical protein IQ250_02770 [Pseudanabaenaceae cyanobacterium LEGE 13415]|nr:hypothetical protein [Pseudanabaenaceae cyanobacterium LEGE 13415]